MMRNDTLTIIGSLNIIEVILSLVD